MKTKTREEVIALQTDWLERMKEIRECWDVNLATEGLYLGTQIAMAGFILETGLTPETVEAFIEEQIAHFEKVAMSRTTRKSPKRSRRPRRPLRDAPPPDKPSD
jgi:hypothetical protein